MSQRKIDEWAIPYVNNFRTYIDIGASVGNTSVPYLNKFQKVIAFEPNPESYAKLTMNPTLTCFNFALSNKEGISVLKIPSQTMNPEHGSIARRRNDAWNGPCFNVQTKLLDSFNFIDVDFIKIDVEQGELEVVLGAMETIKKYRPTVFFENKRNENDYLIELFQGLNYSFVKHKSDTVVYHRNNQ